MKLKTLHYSTEAKSVLHLTVFNLPFSLFPASRALWLLCLNVLFEMPHMGSQTELYKASKRSGNSALFVSYGPQNNLEKLFLNTFFSTCVFSTCFLAYLAIHILGKSST